MTGRATFSNGVKKQLRKCILARRHSLTKKEVREKSQKIKKLLFNLKEFQKAQTIMFYVSFKSEVDTNQMIQETLNLGKKVVVPVVNKKFKLQAAILTNFKKDLVPGAFGLLEPKPEKRRLISPGKINLVIVPGVVFDKCGNRIGFGKGYYDRFLKKMKKQAKLIGLAFEFQVKTKIPCRPYDVKLDKIVTEKKVYRFSRYRKIYEHSEFFQGRIIISS